MTGRHGDKEMADEIVSICRGFGIEKRVADNPTYSDNPVRNVLKRLDPDDTDHLSRRGRCIGHIINLAARQLIFGVDVDAFEFAVAGEGEPDSQIQPSQDAACSRDLAVKRCYWQAS